MKLGNDFVTSQYYSLLFISFISFDHFYTRHLTNHFNALNYTFFLCCHFNRSIRPGLTKKKCYATNTHVILIKKLATQCRVCPNVCVCHDENSMLMLRWTFAHNYYYYYLLIIILSSPPLCQHTLTHCHLSTKPTYRLVILALYH